MTQVAPSILSCDFGNLNQEIGAICQAGADLVHVDVMDGHFVPNMTIGPLIAEAVAKVSTIPLDVHLMVENNAFFVDIFAPCKPKYISFHIEEEKHPHRLIQKIAGLGIEPAVALNPHTPVEHLEHLLDELKMVLIMSVNPGFGGQKFIDFAAKKVEKLKEMIIKRGLDTLIEVDGGVKDSNAKLLRDAGVDILVAGSYVFGSDNYARAIGSLKA